MQWRMFSIAPLIISITMRPPFSGTGNSRSCRALLRWQPPITACPLSAQAAAPLGALVGLISSPASATLQIVAALAKPPCAAAVTPAGAGVILVKEAAAHPD